MFFVEFNLQNAQLPPIIEEEREQDIVGVEDDLTVCDPVNDEKAIVLYNHNPLLQSSSPSVSVSWDLISGFKSEFSIPNPSLYICMHGLAFYKY